LKRVIGLLAFVEIDYLTPRVPCGHCQPMAEKLDAAWLLFASIASCESVVKPDSVE
jgi:hypothetical protein